jgi:NADH:ubiquinone oxidoreductase subunit D
LGGFDQIARGHLLADAVAIIGESTDTPLPSPLLMICQGTMDLVFGEVDR